MKADEPMRDKQSVARANTSKQKRRLREQGSNQNHKKKKHADRPKRMKKARVSKRLKNWLDGKPS
jgi:hypothetical protein